MRGLNRQQRIRRGAATFAIVAFASLTIMSMSEGSTIAEPEFPPLAGDTLKRGSGWTVRTEEFDGNVAAGVIFSSYDRDALLSYAGAARSNARAAFSQRETVPALVTFRRPVPVEEFSGLIEPSGATVISYQIRTIEPDGRRGTLGGAPEPNGVVLDLDHVADFAARQESKGASPLRILGVIDAEVVVDRQSYDALSKLDAVFLVDLTRAMVVDSLSMDLREMIAISDVHLEPLYWHLEDTGLVSSSVGEGP